MAPSKSSGAVPLSSSEAGGGTEQAALSGRQVRTKYWGELIIALVLFVMALLPRCLTLDAFLTVDEPAWIMRSAHFAQSLLRGDLAGTLQTNHPGITTAWTGALGLATYHFLLHPGAGGNHFSDFLTVAGDAYLPKDLLPAVRFPTAVLAALCVAVAYLLLRRVFPRYTSILAVSLIALDPFFITYARVLHHDALGSMFVMVSWLALAVYLTADERKPLYAAVSGVAAGLAWLSKASSLFLGPLTLVAFVVAHLAYRQRGDDGSPASIGMRQWFHNSFLRGFLIWGVAAGLTFLVLWPAMWVKPLDVFATLLGESADLAGAGHLQFFRGEVMTDAGPWFYPVVFFFRATPIALIGAVLSVPCLIAGLWSWRVKALSWRRFSRQWSNLALCYVFIVAFVVFITLSSKKQDRYLLPVFPFIDICAAIGLLSALRWLCGLKLGRPLASAEPLKRNYVATVTYGLVALCVVGMLILAVSYHPYYISYYNPLAGGARQAQETILVGWGEGMDLAGAFLNGKPDAQSLTVAAVPFRTLTPYFEGDVTNYLTSNAPALAADYVVAYVSQVQRKGPDLRLWEYFQARQPEATIRLHGIDYARLYPGPRFLTTYAPEPLQVEVNGNFGDRLTLLGYNSEARQGEVDIDLFWRAMDGLSEDYSFSARLVDRDGHRWAQQEGGWIGGLLPTSQSPSDYVVRDERLLVLPPGMPEDDYTLEMYVYSAASGENLPLIGEVGSLPTFGLKAGTVGIPKQMARVEDAKPQFVASEELAAGVRLVGYDLAEIRVQPGENISPVLYWTALRPLTVDHIVRFRLRAEDGTVAAEVERAIAGSDYSTTRWQPSDVVRDWQSLPVPLDVPSGAYRLDVALSAERQDTPDAGTGNQTGPFPTNPPWFELGEIVVEGRPHQFDLPETVQHSLQADFARQIQALGYDLDTSHLDTDRRLVLTLYWRALAPMADSYKVFVHIVDSAGQIWGQRDAVPLQGEAPTTGWLEGEVLADHFDVSMSADAPPGRYHVRIGWYYEATGQRLPILDERGQVTGDFVALDDAAFLE